MSMVLVTGGSGFIGAHCILQLLAAGHQVRTTVRNLKREGEVRAMLKQGGAEPGDTLNFFAADLESDAGWAEAVRWLRLRAARRLALSCRRAEGRGRVDRARARGRAARAARRARCGRQARRADLVLRRHRLRPEAARPRRSTKPNWTDLNGERSDALREIENHRRARRVGFRGEGKRQARTVGRQSGRRVRPGAGAGLFDLDPAGAAADGRRDARLRRSSISASSMCATSPTCISAR